MTSIKNDEITFVIQGGISDVDSVNKAINSVRQYFNGAKIILSSNEQPPYQYNVDEIVTYDDPGFFYYNVNDKNSKKLNLNRQIASSYAGLAKASTKYAFKLRSDMTISGREFLNFFDKFNQYDDQYKIVQNRILAGCYFTRNPYHKDTPYPYHLGDLMYFGLTTDMQDLFDVPLMSEQESQYCPDQKYQPRYRAEQYMILKFLEKHGVDHQCDSYLQCSNENIELSKAYIANNFVLLTFDQFNVRLPDKPAFDKVMSIKSYVTCITHDDWLHLYNHYANGQAEIPPVDFERQQLQATYHKVTRYKALANIAVALIPNKELRRQYKFKILQFFLKS